MGRSLFAGATRHVSGVHVRAQLSPLARPLTRLSAIVHHNKWSARIVEIGRMRRFRPAWRFRLTPDNDCDRKLVAVAKGQLTSPYPEEQSQRALRFRRRLFSVCPFPRRIDSPNKARQVPHFTHVAFKQSVRLPHCSLVVAAIDNVRRPRNASVITKSIHTINCHRAPSEAQQTALDVRAAPPREKTLLLWRVPRLSSSYYP